MLYGEEPGYEATLHLFPEQTHRRVSGDRQCNSTECCVVVVYLKKHKG